MRTFTCLKKNITSIRNQSSLICKKSFNRKWLLTALLLAAFYLYNGNVNAQSITYPGFVNTGNPLRDSAKYQASLDKYTAWKVSQKKDTKTLPGAGNALSDNATRSHSIVQLNATSDAGNCIIPRDASWIAVPKNDDGFIGPINLGFNFDLYGTSYNEVWINTNGNLTFTAGLSEFNASGFPFSTPMVAAFWADEDTRACGQIFYKLESSHLIVSWEGVGYYDQNCDLLNAFQIIIGTVNDPLIGSAKNVLFNYGSMNWTTGQASGGGPFGGIPATVGINKGNSVDYVQVGRFNLNNSNYDGGGGSNDGVHYLDNKCFSFNVSTGGDNNNIPPSFSGLPVGNTITIQSGSTANLSVQSIGPEINQSITTTVNTNGLCNVSYIISNGAVSTANVTIIGAACNVGTHAIIFTATDNGVPAASSTDTLTVIITPGTSNSCNLSALVKIDSVENSITKTVTITASGGTLPYTFTLSGRISNNTGIFSGLSAGTYNYTVTDSTNCSTTGTFVITSLAPIIAGNIACPVSSSIIADPLSCKAKVTWMVPTMVFPDSISLGPNGNGLLYKGAFNGHGYYQSTNLYSWPDAKNEAVSLGGHLLTINSVEENNFVLNNLKQTNNVAWIGLYNTGTPGSFSWVTGEPLYYTNWITGQPDNFYGNNNDTTIFEPYVQINGWVDDMNRWNDAANMPSVFLAEFESGVISYRQFSGPSNGDSLMPGVYRICYEVTNSASHTLDTCCFEITVLCNSTGVGCPHDTTFIANSQTCMAKVSWTVPSTMYPNNISVAKGSGVNSTGLLTYKGTLNGHGYYQSSDIYTWPQARNAANNVGGHLITITSATENNFLLNNFNQTGNFTWIGLYNTGSVGSFAWVTGEPLSYTNWISGQPDNQYGSNTDTTIFEPYVQINGYYDSTNRWNDAGNISSLFLAEFDNPVISYRQISGPANGDSIMAGVYRVCYEITNSASHTRDTCCFNITVVCNNTSGTNNAMRAQTAQTTEADGHNFNVIAYPNPSNTSFRVKINSDNNRDKITMKVVDITGRIIEMKNNLAPGNTLNIGSKYAPGIYFTTVTQGSKAIVIKLIKQ